MVNHVSKTAVRVWCWGKQWFRDRFRECITCRECGKPVSPWVECCAHCGYGNPARVSTSVMVVIGIGCVLALMLVIV